MPRPKARHSQKKSDDEVVTSAVSLDSLDSLIGKPLQNESSFERGFPIR